MPEQESTSDDTADHLRDAERELQQEHDTSGLAQRLRQVQNDVESHELERTMRLDRARGHLDPAPSSDEAGSGAP